uniref:Uncharacterized protein n=1 Tax=Anguilla anguilla TaxID=7936 RepID=A0A0E9QFG7_ANGAN
MEPHAHLWHRQSPEPSTHCNYGDAASQSSTIKVTYGYKKDEQSEQMCLFPSLFI